MRHNARFSSLRTRAGSDHIGCDKSGTSFAASVVNSCGKDCFAKIESAIDYDDARIQRNKDSAGCEFSAISCGKTGAG
jgi:hypothetical protein